MPTPPSSPTVREKQALHPAQIAIQKPSTLKYHRRVERWFELKVEDFGKIRTFKRDGDNYDQCEDNELQEQHRFHGFSPLVDRIFRTRKNRDLYTRETERGFKALGEFDYGGEDRERVSITYGVDFEKNVCFHRHCKPISSDQILNRTWTSEEVVLPTLTGEEKSYDVEGGWKGDSIDYDPTQQFYEILDQKHDCTIRIFRIKY